ncbi:MAG TPA: tetratricopeptide repeat protein [Oculatellaceae cyanobacterium]|jgi:tetratricopeptide (TPR) repeat protein
MMRTRTKAWAVALSVCVMTTGCLTLSAFSETKVYRANAVYTHEFSPADGYLQTGKYQAAEAKYTRMLKANPKNAAARASLSMAQAELFKLDAAEKNANQVLAQNPKNAMAHLAKGIVYRNRTASLDMTYRSQRDSLLAQSLNELQQAVRLNPKSPEAYNQLGTTYRFMGRYEEAREAFAKALSLDPRYAEAYLNQGIMQLTMGDLAGAKAQFSSAIRLNSKNYMAHYRLGEAHLMSGDAHAALKSLNTALALDPGNAAIMAKMGDAYQAQGNTAAAIAHYRKAIQASPAYMPAYMAISDIFDKRGDGELAMAELRSAINVNPNFTAGRNRLGRLALSVDKPDQAMQYYREALRQNPKDPEAIQGLTQALTIVAQKQATYSQTVGADSDMLNAEQSIQEALRLNPNDMRLHLANLRIAQLTGKAAISQSELQRIASMQPQNEHEAMMQGEAFLALGRYQEADQVFTQLMQRANGNADKLLMIGDTLKINGDLLRAKDAYRMALAAEPGNLKAQRGIERIEKAEAESDKTLRLAKALNTWRSTGKDSSIDFYEDALSKNPRQPEARLALAKLYEKTKAYNKAAMSYQFYLGLRPDLTDKERQAYERKIATLQEKALRAAGQQRPQYNLEHPMPSTLQPAAIQSGQPTLAPISTAE